MPKPRGSYKYTGSAIIFDSNSCESHPCLFPNSLRECTKSRYTYTVDSILFVETSPPVNAAPTRPRTAS